MWKEVESATRPSELDTASSKVYNYVRRNIREEEREVNGETIVYYVFEEQRIRKEDWDTYAKVIQNTQDVADITDALIELAELIGG